jgi:Tfp pilus assembly protein PilO
VSEVQQHRIISLASILVMLLIPVIGWFLVAQPQLAAAATADQQRADTEAQIVASAAVVAQLKADSEKLPELNQELNALRASIPFGADPSGYIDGLDALAKLAHVEITGLTVKDGIAYIAAAPAGAAPAVTPDDSTEAEGDAATPAPVADPAFVTSPLIDSTNFVTIPVSVQVTGEWAQILKFVQGIQSSPRLFLVSSLSTEADHGAYTATVGGFIYAIPAGVEGQPKPISTIVKQMDGPGTAADAEDSADAEGDSAGDDEAPSPDATDTPEP